MPATPDRDLIVHAQHGDPDAFGELVRRYQASVFNVCYRLAGERREAEDLAQEAFIRAYQRVALCDARLPFGPWMRKLATNVCLNRLQRRWQASEPLDDEHDERLASSDGDPARADQAEALRAALACLPPVYRAVVELRHFQELSYAEIAAALDLPLSAVKSYLFRARKKLARTFNADD